MRLGSCRASLTRPAAPTSEKSDLLKLRLSHRETGVVIVCRYKFPIGVCASRGQSASSKSWSSIAACTSLSPTGVFRHSMILCINRFAVALIHNQQFTDIRFDLSD